jgi:hypothetical protein
MNYLGIIISLLLPFLFLLIWLFLVYRFWKNRIFGLIPPEIRKYLVDRLKIEYQPYQASLNNLKTVLVEMLKISVLVFVTGLLILILVYGPVLMPSIFHRP